MFFIYFVKDFGVLVHCWVYNGWGNLSKVWFYFYREGGCSLLENGPNFIWNEFLLMEIALGLTEMGWLFNGD